MAISLPSLGCDKNEIDTPILCVDLDVMEANIRAISGQCRQHSVGWRPHIKSHKSPRIARKLIDAGAIGVTCAKLGEAEVMAAAGIEELLVANMIVGPKKLARLVDLRRQTDLLVCVDHPLQAEAFDEVMRAAGLRLRVLVEVDLGMNRVGVAPGDATLRLAGTVDQLPGLQLAGIMGYEGHLLGLADPQEKDSRIRETLGWLVETKELLLRAGLPCPIVSCGGTGSFAQAVRQPGITELQAGGGIFMDAFYRYGCHVDQGDFALTVLATVVSRPTTERAVIDAGRKTMNVDVHPAFVVGRSDIQVESLSAEHGSLRLAPSAQDLPIGHRLEIVPGYSDLTCVLHDYMYGFRGNRLEVIWPLEARGRLQ